MSSTQSRTRIDLDEFWNEIRYNLKGEQELVQYIFCYR